MTGNERSRGRFITFEGIDGAGKTTQITALAGWLEERGIRVVRTREPGGTPAGERVREVLLSEDMGAMAETLLFFAARAEHIGKVIEPALAAGSWVLSDRFTDATYAYQVGGKGFSPAAVEELESLVQGALQPDRTVLFDISPEAAAARLAEARSGGDRFERESREFFRRVRGAYLSRAQAAPGRFLVLDAGEPPETITERLLVEAAKWL